MVEDAVELVAVVVVVVDLAEEEEAVVVSHVEAEGVVASKFLEVFMKKLKFCE